ncbi:MAG: hypothetical protein VKO39_03265 [Cyanobacteriota bacterium]|nr:hypothetical protein [Cyanobacteriota bacterium]
MALPPGALPPGALPPGALPPGAIPADRSPALGTSRRPSSPEARDRAARSQPWTPWLSVGMALLLAGGVTGLVLLRRQRRQRQLEADRDGSRPGA